MKITIELERHQVDSLLRQLTTQPAELSARSIMFGLKPNSRDFLKELFKKYNYTAISRSDAGSIAWKHRVTDVATLLKNLEKRGVLRIKWKEGGNRIELFTFLTEIV